MGLSHCRHGRPRCFRSLSFAAIVVGILVDVVDVVGDDAADTTAAARIAPNAGVVVFLHLLDVRCCDYVCI